MAGVTLDGFIEEFGSRIVIDNENYPKAVLSTAESTQEFVVDHGLKHLMKGAAAVARISEACDHGADLDEEALKVAVAKTLVTLANIAHKFNISGGELAGIASREMASQ